MDRVLNRQTTWYVINIKARRNQTPQHYVDAWNLINEQDPLIELPKTTNRFASIRTMSFSQQCDNDNIPHYIETKLVAYEFANKLKLIITKHINKVERNKGTHAL